MHGKNMTRKKPDILYSLCLNTHPTYLHWVSMLHTESASKVQMAHLENIGTIQGTVYLTIYFTEPI